MAAIDDIDLAEVGACPGCGDPVRRFASVPIGGSGLDLIHATVAWCASCTRARTMARIPARLHGLAALVPTKVADPCGHPCPEPGGLDRCAASGCQYPHP